MVSITENKQEVEAWDLAQEVYGSKEQEAGREMHEGFQDKSLSETRVCLPYSL